MTRNEMLDKLLSKYGKYGYTHLKISGLIKDSEKHGFFYTVIYNGLRMAFSNVTGEHEYFSLQDMMEVTGETQDELVARIEDSKKELRKNGEDPDDYLVQVTPRELRSWRRLKYLTWRMKSLL